MLVVIDFGEKKEEMRLLAILIQIGVVSSALAPPTIGVNTLYPSSKLKSDSLEKLFEKLQNNNEIASINPISSKLPSKEATSSNLYNTTQFGGLMLLWYFFTVVYNISNKNALNALPLPAVVSCLQLLVGLPLFLPLWVFKMPKLTLSTLKSFWSFSILHALGLLTSVMALEAGSVSFTQIVRAAEPVFAAIFSNIFLKEIFSLPVILSLIPIIGGVGIASMTDFTFTQRSFLLAMFSNVFYQLRIVLTKRYMTNSSPSPSSASSSLSISSRPSYKALTPSEIFQVLTVLSTIQLIPIALFLERKKILPAWNALRLSTISLTTPLSGGGSGGGFISSIATKIPFFKQFYSQSTEGVRLFITNVLISGLSFYFHNVIGFRLLKLVSPVSFAIANTIKRVVIIFASMWIFNTPMSIQSLIGSGIAIGGTFLYSLIQQRQQHQQSLVEQQQQSQIEQQSERAIKKLRLEESEL